MRLVVDTNVFVSAALKENSLPFLVAGWIDQHDGLLKSAATEQQLPGRPAPALHSRGDDPLFARRSGEDAGGGRAVATSHLHHPDSSYRPRS